MLTISPEKVCYIIVKAREFDVKDADTELEEGSNPADDLAVGVLEEHAGDPTYEELMGALRELNRDELLDVAGLLWIGRGDFDASQWDDARANGAEYPDLRLAQYIVGTPLFGDFLEEGLAAFDISCEEFEIGRL